MTRPSQFPPPYSANNFIAAPKAAADLQLKCGVLFVGAGPASLAGSIRLMQLLETAPEIKSRLGDFPVAIVEKGKFVGAHLLSGAIVNPIAFRHLFPKLKDSDFPFYDKVDSEAVYFLTAKQAMRIPTPPTMKNHGYYSASISKMGAWLGAEAEKLGITILCETAATQLLLADGKVLGVRTGDKGRDQKGGPMPSFAEGTEILAQCTVFGEGTQGHLSRVLIEKFGLENNQPQISALGVKEVWKVKKPLAQVIHTMGWPLKLEKKYHEFGGSFVYPYGEDKVAIGLVVGTDNRDSSLSVHDLLQEMKLHPLFQNILEGGERIAWGAKTIPEGGYYALPKKLNAPGALVVGDSAGFVNVPALKGIHYAMWSGILAAEQIFAQLKDGKDLQEIGTLDAYDHAVKNSFISKDLYEVRNMRQAFSKGFFVGGALAGLMTATKGAIPGNQIITASDAEQPMFIGKRDYPKADNKLTFNKLSSVHAAGNRSQDKQPNHIRIQTDVPQEIGEAWINMCPAEVYEWKTDASGKRQLFVNPTNCIHCCAITAKGGRLTTPEGGSGPEYTEM